MKTSHIDHVKDLYQNTAQDYADMMEREIELPIYKTLLERLNNHIKALDGYLIDTSSGSGHMLELYHHSFDQRRKLIGVDLSPNMVEISAQKASSSLQFLEGDMRYLTQFDSDTAAALISFFAIHHLNPSELVSALKEWYRVMKPGGYLLVGAWEGSGVIDYNGETDVIALRYKEEELCDAAETAGFSLIRSQTEAFEDFPMDAIYLEATKA